MSNVAAYLDYNAGALTRPAVVEAVAAALADLGLLAPATVPPSVQ